MRLLRWTNDNTVGISKEKRTIPSLILVIVLLFLLHAIILMTLWSTLSLCSDIRGKSSMPIFSAQNTEQRLHIFWITKCRLRRKQGIARMWLILSLIHFLCCTVSGWVGSFDEGYNYFRNCVLYYFPSKNATNVLYCKWWWKWRNTR